MTFFYSKSPTFFLFKNNKQTLKENAVKPTVNSTRSARLTPTTTPCARVQATASTRTVTRRWDVFVVATARRTITTVRWSINHAWRITTSLCPNMGIAMVTVSYWRVWNGVFSFLIIFSWLVFSTFITLILKSCCKL